MWVCECAGVWVCEHEGVRVCEHVGMRVLKCESVNVRDSFVLVCTFFETFREKIVLS